MMVLARSPRSRARKRKPSRNSCQTLRAVRSAAARAGARYRMSSRAAAETAKVAASSRNATDVLTVARSAPAKAQPRISVRFSLVENSELARSSLPGVTISGSTASLAGSKKTPAVAIAKLSANTAGSERVATKGTATTRAARTRSTAIIRRRLSAGRRRRRRERRRARRGACRGRTQRPCPAPSRSTCTRAKGRRAPRAGRLSARRTDQPRAAGTRRCDGAARIGYPRRRRSLLSLFPPKRVVS